MSKKQSQKKRSRQRFFKNAFKNWILWGSLSILLLFGAFGLFGKGGVVDLFRLQALHQSLQSEVNDLLDEHENLRAEVSRLQDSRYIQHLARDQMGLLGKDEFFIIIDDVNDDSTVLPNKKIPSQNLTN
ncbi:MAG: septum formation initiator family protein [Deltaproteobacteria bacterium]|nr:septum formation initiator family protein [Deltaproteobacteria bacterium]